MANKVYTFNNMDIEQDNEKALRYASLAAEKQSAFKEVVKFILDGRHGLNPEISEQTINEAFDCVIYSEKATLYTQEMQKEERERDPLATISKMETVQEEGNRNIRRIVDFYSLDAIISVGYRVNCTKATNFRIWTTQVLKEFIKKGFVLDDDRLKQGKTAFGIDYFRELLEKVQRPSKSMKFLIVRSISTQTLTNIFVEY